MTEDTPKDFLGFDETDITDVDFFAVEEEEIKPEDTPLRGRRHTSKKRGKNSRRRFI